MPLFRKLPQRGFSNVRFRKEYAIVNVRDLEKIGGEEVNLNSAKAAGLVLRNASRIKLLGMGEVRKAFKVKVDKCSASAEEKIKIAGGSVEIA